MLLLAVHVEFAWVQHVTVFSLRSLYEQNTKPKERVSCSDAVRLFYLHSVLS
jgi:hypothetical protein